MRRYVGAGAVLVLLAIFAPTAATGGVSGIFWAFTLGVLFVWLAGLSTRVRAERPPVAAPTSGHDDGYY